MSMTFAHLFSLGGFPPANKSGKQPSEAAAECFLRFEGLMLADMLSGELQSKLWVLTVLARRKPPASDASHIMRLMVVFVVDDREHARLWDNITRFI